MGPDEKAEMLRKASASRRGKNLAFSEDTKVEKEESAVKSNPKKSWSRIETVRRV